MGLVNDVVAAFPGCDAVCTVVSIIGNCKLLHRNPSKGEAQISIHSRLEHS